MMEVIIVSGAEVDIDEIYAALDETNGGDKFLHSLDVKLGLIRNFPEIAPRSQVAVLRKTRIGKTVFGLFYKVEGRRIMVIAVQDLRQDPKTIAKTIRRRL